MVKTTSGELELEIVRLYIERPMKETGSRELAVVMPCVRQLAEDPGWQVDAAKALVAALQAILRGSRDPALAENPALDYDDAVEVQLLLEALGSGL